MEENINALDEIHKGACMGIDAIHFVLDKVEDDNLKKVLKKEYEEYQKIAGEIEIIYPKYDDGNPHETGMMTKAMTWYGIEMKTLTDKSNSKIAELLLQGFNMGIIEGKRILNQKEIDKEVADIIEKYVEMQERDVETLKKFL
jgi:hypothetical protein